MPLWLLVHARPSTGTGSWAKGDIVEARPEDTPWGTKERPPRFVRCFLNFQNTPDAEWVNTQYQDGGGRRSIGLTEAEVDSIIAGDPVNGEKSYSSAGQFISRLESKA